MPFSLNSCLRLSTIPSICSSRSGLRSASCSAISLYLGGIHVAEGQILKFPLDLPDAQSIGERGEDVERLLGNSLALALGHVAQGPHVVQAVGELDQHHSHVIAHGEEGLAQRFGGQVAAPAQDRCTRPRAVSPSSDGFFSAC